MRILVTGVANSTGTYLCQLLGQAGHEVVILCRNRYNHLVDEGYEYIQCDIRDKQSLLKEISNVEAIIHLAAKSNSWGAYEDFYQHNVIGTKTLLEVCNELGIKYFVFASSSSVAFTKSSQKNLVESTHKADEFFSDFSKTKSIAEDLVVKSHGANLKTIALRFPILWSKDPESMIAQMISKAKENELIKIGHNDSLVDILYYKNAALSTLRALDGLVENHSIGGYPYFVSQERPVKFWEFLNDILTFYKIDLIEDSYSYNYAYRVASVKEAIYKILGILNPPPSPTKEQVIRFGKDHYFSNEKAKQAFNYNPDFSIEQALKECYAQMLNLKDQINCL